MINEYLNEIKKKLSGVESLDNRRNALSGLSILLIILSAGFIFVSILESLFGFNSFIRTIIFYALLLSTAILLIYFVLIPYAKSFFLFSNPDFHSASKKVGDAFSEIKDELLNSIELLSGNYSGYSAELVNEAFKRVYKKTESVDFKKSIDFSGTKRKFRIGLASAIASVILIILVPGFSASALRIINYSRDFTPPQKFYFNVIPGNKEITKGESIKITITANGESPSKISLLTKSEEQTEFNKVA
ncbi:MAG: hypothetical protein KGZ42_04060, partial [Melioribacter sp.]|nr:hypothetical protein [Melioribacter sp.]